MRLIFFDHDSDRIQSYIKMFEDYNQTISTLSVEFKCIDVEALLDQESIHALVLPAHTNGELDGEIDNAYARLFPGLEAAVKKRIKEVTNTGTLRIGSAVLLGINNKKCPFLMIMPILSNLEELKLGNESNIYWATVGLLSLMHNIKKKKLTVAVPCLGTGLSQMNASQSAIQVRKAIECYFFKRVDHVQSIVKNTKTSFVLEPFSEADNIEIKTEITAES